MEYQELEILYRKREAIDKKLIEYFHSHEIDSVEKVNKEIEDLFNQRLEICKKISKLEEPLSE